jgi:hypothetical protein
VYHIYLLVKSHHSGFVQTAFLWMPLAGDPVACLRTVLNKPKNVETVLHGFDGYLVTLGQFGDVALTAVPVISQRCGRHQHTEREVGAESFAGWSAALVKLGGVPAIDDVFQFVQQSYALLNHWQVGVDENVPTFGAWFTRAQQSFDGYVAQWVDVDARKPADNLSRDRRGCNAGFREQEFGLTLGNLAGFACTNRPRWREATQALHQGLRSTVAER